MRENAAAKGRRLLTEGRLRVTAIGPDTLSAACMGDSAEVYEAGWDPEFSWWCRCPALGKCSHLVALQLVVMRPGVAHTKSLQERNDG